MPKIAGLIIAGNYQQYKDWTLQYGLHPADYKYIDDKHIAYGYRNIPILLIGEYWKSLVNPFELEEMIND